MSAPPKYTSLGVCCLVLALLGASARTWAVDAPPAQLAGSWLLTVDSPMGKRNPTVQFAQQGNALTGTYTGGFGSAPIEGRVDGNRFTFTFEARAMMRSARITYTGAIQGDTIGGDVAAAGMGNGKFSGVRKP